MKVVISKIVYPKFTSIFLSFIDFFCFVHIQRYISYTEIHNEIILSKYAKNKRTIIVMLKMS